MGLVADRRVGTRPADYVYGFGILGNIAVGIVGTLIGSWLLPQLGIILGSGILASIVNATAGAILLLVVLGSCAAVVGVSGAANMSVPAGCLMAVGPFAYSVPKPKPSTLVCQS